MLTQKHHDFIIDPHTLEEVLKKFLFCENVEREKSTNAKTVHCAHKSVRRTMALFFLLRFIPARYDPFEIVRFPYIDQ